MKKNGSAGKTKLTDAESFRSSMQVTELYHFRDGSVYAVCPRCHVTLEREYQAYCDRCGQCLDWRSFRHATVIMKP